MGILRHIAADTAILAGMLGTPLLLSPQGRAWISGETDAVSGATVVIAQPSGEYVVYLNTERHPDTENLKLWEQFFEGTDTPLIFEDITCLTVQNDAAGRTLADSFRTRLPENQMRTHAIEGTLLISKAEYGLFDVVVISKEYAESLRTEKLESQKNVLTIQVKGAAE